MRFYFSLRHVAATLLVVALMLTGVRWRMNQPPNASAVSRTVNRKLSTLCCALDLHQAVNGSLPYDARGAEFAVFHLNGRVDASDFDIVATGENRARWNLEKSMLVNGEIHYCNVAKPNSKCMIILSTDTLPPFDTVHFCTVDCVTGWVTNTSGSELSLLGNYLSVEGSIIVSHDVFRLWCELHPQEGAGTIVAGDDGVEYGIGLTIDTIRNDLGHISQCRCRLGDLEAIEHVSTDRWGRIVSIERRGQAEELIAAVAKKLAGNVSKRDVTTLADPPKPTAQP